MAQEKKQFKLNEILNMIHAEFNAVRHLKKQTAVEWLGKNLIGNPHVEEDFRYNREVFDQAKQMEKEQMIKFAEFVATYRDKNKNYKSEMLHAKSKYDQAERTIDLLEEYYNETYNK